MKTLRPLFGVLGVLGFLCLSFVWQACNTGLCEKDAQCSGGLRCIDGSCQLSNSHECWTDKDCEGKSGGSFRCQVEPISFRHFCVKIDDGTVPTACKSPCATNDDCKDCAASRNLCQNGVCSVPTQTCGGCTQDSDCAQCPGDYSCKEGICAQNLPQSCPAACTKDAECALCTDKTSCIEGTCQKEPTTSKCPSLCRLDVDCTNCGTKNTCIEGTCQEKPPENKCPESCEANVDCAFCELNKNKCIDNKCVNTAVCPGKCSDDKDCETCSDNKRACVNSACVVKPTSCPDSCQDNTGCPAYVCGDKLSCISGKCISTRKKKPGDTCDFTVDDNCGGDLFCYPVNSRIGTCYQRCPSTSSGCSVNNDGRTTCGNVVGSTTVSACIRVNEAGRNCGHDIQTNCKTGENPPLYCYEAKTICTAYKVISKEGAVCGESNKTICDATMGLKCIKDICTCTTGSSCTPKTTAKVFEECGGTTGAVCDANLVCTEVKPGSGARYCLEKCNLARPVCSAGTCQQIGTSTVCMPKGFVAEDHKCKGGGDVLETCRDGLLCVIFSAGASTGLCIPSVQGGCQPGSCATGRTCITISSGQGLCLKDCSQSDTCPKPDSACVTIQQGAQVCGPSTTTQPGTQDFGEKCDQNVTCKSGLTCLPSSGPNTGFCSKTCSTQADCPSVTNAAGVTIASSCTSLSGVKFCAFPCSLPGTTCPDNMTCQSLPGFGDFCAP